MNKLWILFFFKFFYSPSNRMFRSPNMCSSSRPDVLDSPPPHPAFRRDLNFYRRPKGWEGRCFKPPLAMIFASFPGLFSEGCSKSVLVVWVDLAVKLVLWSLKVMFVASILALVSSNKSPSDVLSSFSSLFIYCFTTCMISSLKKLWSWVEKLSFFITLKRFLWRGLTLLTSVKCCSRIGFQ